MTDYFSIDDFGTTELTVISEASTCEMESITTVLHTEETVPCLNVVCFEEGNDTITYCFCAHLETLKSAVVNPEVFLACSLFN